MTNLSLVALPVTLETHVLHFLANHLKSKKPNQSNDKIQKRIRRQQSPSAKSKTECSLISRGHGIHHHTSNIQELTSSLGYLGQKKKSKKITKKANKSQKSKKKKSNKKSKRNPTQLNATPPSSPPPATEWFSFVLHQSKCHIHTSVALQVKHHDAPQRRVDFHCLPAPFPSPLHLQLEILSHRVGGGRPRAGHASGSWKPLSRVPYLVPDVHTHSSTAFKNFIQPQKKHKEGKRQRKTVSSLAESAKLLTLELPSYRTGNMYYV